MPFYFPKAVYFPSLFQIQMLRPISPQPDLRPDLVLLWQGIAVPDEIAQSDRVSVFRTLGLQDTGLHTITVRMDVLTS